jgi:hypothetical protein
MSSRRLGLYIVLLLFSGFAAIAVPTATAAVETASAAASDCPTGFRPIPDLVGGSHGCGADSLCGGPRYIAGIPYRDINSNCLPDSIEGQIHKCLQAEGPAVYIFVITFPEGSTLGIRHCTNVPGQVITPAAPSPVPASQRVCVSVAGAAGDYAIANATITDPADSGFATVHSSTADWQASSTNNFTAGASLPNLTITKIGADGKICMTSSVATHMILDVAGYIKAGAVTPVTTPSADRIVDTRTAVCVVFDTSVSPAECVRRVPGTSASPKIPAGKRVCTQSGGAEGDYVIANATITDPADSGFATVHSSTADWQASSTNNFTAGASLPNLTITKIGVAGKFCMTSSAATHMILDVVGYLKASSITPVSTTGADRVLDTRTSNICLLHDGVGRCLRRGPNRPASPPVAGPGDCVSLAGVPGDYVIANATITGPASDGFATVYNSTADWQASSTNNFTAGASLPNLTITKIGADGLLCMTSSAATHMILDVVGYLKSSAVTPVLTVGADRVLDTRR